jgi:signal transduction histidine kinase
VENAAKYGAPPITLAARRDDGALVLDVTDEGPGIPAAERARVFDAFYRADRARTPSARGAPSQGFGLGLTLARRIVEAHRGGIAIAPARVEGSREVGCRVTLRLPLGA